MPWTKKAFYAKFLKSRSPQPQKVAAIRIDYNPADGWPIAASVQAFYDCNDPESCPTLDELEATNPVMGLCSWTYVAVYQANLENVPHVITQPYPRQQAAATTPQAQPQVPTPTSIVTKEAIPDEVYCNFCGHLDYGIHQEECDRYVDPRGRK